MSQESYHPHIPYWYALAFLSGLSARQSHRILDKWRASEHKGDIRLLFLADRSEWEQAKMDTRELLGLEQAKDYGRDAVEAVSAVHLAGIATISCEDENYPIALTQTLGHTRPLLLFYSGSVSLLQQPAVSIIGSREPSQSALEFTRATARAMAEQKICVVSGWAEGVDRCASETALSETGTTILVLAQGILTFTRGQKTLINSIDIGKALVLSAFAPRADWQTPLAMARNAIITALVNDIVVGESKESGGTWETSRMGLRQNKRVWVREDSRAELGHDSLEKLGAHIVVWPGEHFDRWTEELASNAHQQPPEKMVQQWTEQDAMQLLREASSAEIHDACGLTGNTLIRILEERENFKLQNFNDLRQIKGIGTEKANDVAVAFGLGETKYKTADLFPDTLDWTSDNKHLDNTDVPHRPKPDIDREDLRRLTSEQSE